MLERIRAWRRKRALERNAIAEGLWQQVLGRFEFFDGLDEGELARLRELTALILHEKSIHAAQGYAISQEMRIVIAAQAALVVLNLGIEWYRGWVEVIVYPDEFVPEHEYTDEHGIVHRLREARTGESWEAGPLILSWADVESPDTEAGYNVVVHEFAHKLDMLNGASDGLPPLHPGMTREAWSAAFGAAYDDLCRRVDAGKETVLDPYACEGPDEFFAVASEAFFLIPRGLLAEYPGVYGQLRAFYRQDPAARLGG